MTRKLEGVADALGVIDDYRRCTTRIKAEHPELVQRLMSALEAAAGNPLHLLLDSVIADTAVGLEAAAANACVAAGSGEAELAAALCEEWATANISGGGAEARVLCLLDALGVDKGARTLSGVLAPFLPAPATAHLTAPSN